MSSKIEEIINEIEDYIDNCKPSAFSAKNITVNKDEIDSLIAELKTRTPEEIRQYQKIINSREAILADARQRADQIVNMAEIKTTELVSEHQIMQQAYAQANEVIMLATKTAQDKIDKATEEANGIRLAAISYTDEILANIQTILSGAISTTKSYNNNFLNTMQTYLDTVEANRAALTGNDNEELPEEPASVNTVDISASSSLSSDSVSDEDDLKLDIPDEFFDKKDN